MFKQDEIFRKLVENETALKKFGVKRIGIFGSFARGEESESSDLDFIVELERETFDDYMDLKFFLEDLFGRKVDLVLPDSIKPRLKPIIMKEVIYAAGF